jgi:hypothetical protein
VRPVLLIVDGENVRRSRWPNLSQRDLVAAARRWTAAEGHDLLVVFDGRAPEDAPDVTAARHADDAIVAAVEGERRPVWVVTSDRGLRARLAGAERLVGGGTFLTMLAS